MIEGGTAANIIVCSVHSFAALFIEYERYRTVRTLAPFGSAVDPQTGERDEVSYVPVQYIDRLAGREYTSAQIAERISEGKHVILLGEYGSGKSRCISEVFSAISNEWGEIFSFTFAINLRECWGMRTGEELIRRHMLSLGLDDLAPAAVNATKRRSAIFLLDGFDEMGSQSWSVDDAKLKQLRAQALEGVKDIARNSGTGMLVAGREHYFSSREEMFLALGLIERDTIVLSASDQFTVEQMEQYFDAAGIAISLPDWLPRRPLICQTISKLDEEDFDRMFGLESREAVFWNHFIDILCKRDARISAAFDSETIFRVYIELARKSRNKPMNVGPFNLRELQDAFEAAVGQPPAEGASVMLQRLPSLGRIGAESTDRQFIDMYILDGLRGRDVARLTELDDDSRKQAFHEVWTNPLGAIGQKVLALQVDQKENQYVTLAGRASNDRNAVLAGDIVCSLVRSGSSSVDYQGLIINEATIGELDMTQSYISNLRIKNSIIERLVLPTSPPSNTILENCSAAVVAGAASKAGLPGWAKLDIVDEFDSVQTVARIKNAGLSINQEVFVAIIKKTFFQKGAGRKEEALIRGFGMGAAQGVAPKMLNLLLRENVLKKFKGDDGWVYTPNRAKAGRMNAILAELRSTNDELWAKIEAV